MHKILKVTNFSTSFMCGRMPCINMSERLKII